MLKVFDFEHTPIVDIVNEILVDASSRGASDIHFDPKDNVLQIRIRIDGELVNYATVPEEYVKNLITRIKIISGMNITESRLPQDGAIKGVVKNIELDLRVSSINTNKGEKIVIRILDYTLSLNGIEQLGFSDYNYKKVIEMINEPNGIILVTGATGTGKTTTVYSMLQRLSNETTNIMSIEDPVEMDIENVNQIQVNADIGLTFATALRSILRQDPNIIMIGEIRDSETATIAIRASVTGHLVLSTLHTNDSLSTIERLMDMDVEKYLLAEALEGIISQRLARKLCPHCRKLRKTTTYEKELIKKVLNMDVDEIYEAVGCEKCNHGYKSRIAFQEVLKIDQKIQDALSMNIRKDKLRNLVYNDSVITLLQDGMIKVLRGDTTIEELLRLVEFEDDSIITYNLSKDILDSEINKKDDYYLESKDDIDNEVLKDNIDDNIIEEEVIIPDTNDVVIDSIDDTTDNEDTEPDIDNMESLDNDEDFVDKIDEVIEESEINNDIDTVITPVENTDIVEENIIDNKKEKKKKDKKKNKDKKKKKTEEPEEVIEILEDTDNNETTYENNTGISISDELIDTALDEIKSNEEVIEDTTFANDNEEIESLDNDDSFDEKLDEVLENSEPTDSEIINEEAESDSNNQSKDDEIIEEEAKENIPVNDNEEIESLDNDDSFGKKIDEVLENNEVVSEEKESKKKKRKKKKKDKKSKDDITVDDNEEMESLENDNSFVDKIDEIIENNTDSNADIIDEIDNNEITIDNSDTLDINNNEITDKEIEELEEVIETIKVNDNVSDETIETTNEDMENDIEDTIKISINEDDVSDNDINVSEVKTISKTAKENDEMEPLDYNTNFIDKIYDSITNSSEKKIIEKDNIDYEKIERLESMQNEIGSRVSRMLNKKRYRKIKKDE